ncbi:hypothetical protein [Amycolatopsis panacis]|nr:hypothetical protein [Amycolatopsis panacis]
MLGSAGGIPQQPSCPASTSKAVNPVRIHHDIADFREFLDPR